MITRDEQRGPHHPVAGTPARSLGSVRRTSTIDTSRPEGITGPALMRAVGRDLVTGPAGTVAAATATVDAVLEPYTRSLRGLSTTPAVDALDPLVGTSVASGFRGRLDALAPGLAGRSSLLHLLLDDLPGAALVGGYAFLRADALRPVQTAAQALTVDICAGWADGSTMISAIRATGETPTPFGPPAPDLTDPADPLAWHAAGDPGVHGTRRARRIDVGARGADGLCAVDAFFRDSHWSADAGETVIHEYSISAVVDPAGPTVVEIVAAPDVLPWMECPAAIGSAQRVVGRPAAELRQWVRAELRGTSTCTHLNDTLRSLADLPALLALRP